jgi:hypothetical protein
MRSSSATARATDPGGELDRDRDHGGERDRDRGGNRDPRRADLKRAVPGWHVCFRPRPRHGPRPFACRHGPFTHVPCRAFCGPCWRALGRAAKSTACWPGLTRIQFQLELEPNLVMQWVLKIQITFVVADPPQVPYFCAYCIGSIFT